MKLVLIMAKFLVSSGHSFLLIEITNVLKLDTHQIVNLEYCQCMIEFGKHDR